MIKINLLPVKQNKKQERAIVQLIFLGAAWVIALVIIYIVDDMERRLISAKETESADLAKKIEQMDKIIGDIQTIGKVRDELQQKISVIASLRTTLSVPVRTLDKLSSAVPEKLWLISLENTRNPTEIDLKGESVNEKIIAQFVQNLESDPYFKNVNLKKTNFQGPDRRSFELSLAFSPDKKGAAEAGGK
ncbi:MAG: hypothetical protein GMKNLPBB_01913 [Myxococcota bacterium]|nr:hypothetical protein [Myxococcota bacterium]